MTTHIHLHTPRKFMDSTFSIYEKVNFRDPQYGVIKGYYQGIKPGNRVYIKADRRDNPKLGRGQESFNVPMGLVSKGW